LTVVTVWVGELAAPVPSGWSGPNADPGAD
jgi:hypothetical protein